MNDNPRRVRLMFTLLILTSITLLTIDYRTNSDSPLRPVERAVASVVGPVQRSVGRGMSSVTGGVHFGTAQRDKIRRLEQENANLAAQLATTDQIRNELKELKELSGLADKWKTTPARIIGRGTAVPDPWTLQIDVGSADGVQEQTTVLTGGANGASLLGKVVSVREHDSTVRLINDSTVGIAINLTRNGEGGFVFGQGDGPMRLTLDSPTADMRVGDVLVTRGSANDKPFYPGIAVGTITRIQASPGSSLRVAEVTPFGVPGTLQYVGVVTSPGPDVPRKPFSPTPGASATPAPTGTNATPAPTGTNATPAPTGTNATSAPTGTTVSPTAPGAAIATQPGAG